MRQVTCLSKQALAYGILLLQSRVVKRFHLFKLLLPLVVATAATAVQADTLYSNGSINGTVDYYFISSSEIITNSFTLAGAAILDSAELGLATSSGTPASLQWQIGTTPFGAEISSGTASLTSTFHNTGPYDAATYDSTFTLSGVLPGAGTYYLTLSNGRSSDSTQLGWDENDGPSTAQGRYNNTSITPAGSESFTLSGINLVPEPSTWAMFGLGAVGAGVVASRRRRVTAWILPCGTSSIRVV